MILLAAACTTLDPGDPCVPGGPHVLLTTTDYEVGALSAVEPGGCTADAMASSGPDAVARAVGDRVAVFDRTGGDAVRLYVSGDYTAPEVEFALDRGGNTHDVARVGSELWFTRYEEDALQVTDLEGAELGRVDLSEHADADGLPEADRLVVRDDRLYVGLQRLDRGLGFAPAGDGRVVELDPITRAAVGSWDVGANPKLGPDPADPGGLLVTTGRYFVSDGALYALEPATGVSTPLVTEEALGFDLSGFAGVGSDLVLLGVDFEVGGPSRIACLDRATGEWVVGLETAAWPVEAVAAERTVYVAVRTGWSGGQGDELLEVDPVTCDVTTVADGFALDPFSVAFVP